MSSKLAELGREEAERVEAETPDAPDAEPDAPDAEPEAAPGDAPDADAAPAQPPAPTEQELEARMQAWDKERDRHMRELRKRDPNRYEVSEPCPLCDGHGLYLAQIGEPDASQRRDYIAAVLGGADAPALMEATDKETCAACDGWGQTRTGSKVGGQDALPCAACNGQGWRYRGSVATPPAPSFAPAMPNLVAPPNGAEHVVTDPWGRPLGHNDYGRAPSEVNA
jgi:hypothetical protein